MPPRKLPQPLVDILLVEDHPGEIRLIREALNKLEPAACLHVTRDGQQALTFLRREHPYLASPRPALILLDLNLPRKHGIEVLAELRRDPDLRDIPVVVLSNSNRLEDVTRANALRASAFVTKPLDLDKLAQIRTVVQRFVPAPPAQERRLAATARSQSTSQRIA